VNSRTARRMAVLPRSSLLSTTSKPAFLNIAATAAASLAGLGSGTSFLYAELRQYPQKPGNHPAAPKLMTNFNTRAEGSPQPMQRPSLVSR
jgi:hypothetical protein